MQRPPRSPDEPLLPRALIVWGSLQGALAFVLTGAILVTAARVGMPDDEVRALVFFSLVLVIVSLIFVNRSFSSSLIDAFRRSNPMLIVVVVFVAAVLTLTLLWLPAAKLFRFGRLHADDLSITIASALVSLVLLELSKFPLRAALTRRSPRGRSA